MTDKTGECINCRTNDCPHDPDFASMCTVSSPCPCHGTSVPDADGNPIVIGQLVEDIADLRVYRVDKVDLEFGNHDAMLPRPAVGIEGEPGHYKSKNFRVLTDTCRPPEPETRDVVLRVALTVGPDVRDADIESDVREGIYQSGSIEADYASITVEVVE